MTKSAWARFALSYVCTSSKCELGSAQFRPGAKLGPFVPILINFRKIWL